MLFNSFEFALFLPIVFLLYWFVFQKYLKAQNLLIVAVSYLFYGWWDWRFLLLIALTTTASYLSGTLIKRYRDHRRAKLIATSNVVLNLAILCAFKYFNFFSENLAQLFRTFGYELDWVTLDILLPVGISFYTFQALSYTIDVYKKKIEPTHDVVSFFRLCELLSAAGGGSYRASDQSAASVLQAPHFRLRAGGGWDAPNPVGIVQKDSGGG